MYDWPDLRKLNVNEWMRRKIGIDYGMAYVTMFTCHYKSSPLRMQADEKHSIRKGESSVGL